MYVLKSANSKNRIFHHFVFESWLMHKRDSQVLLAEGQAVFPKEALNLADLCFKSDTFMEQPHNPYHKPKKIYIYIYFILNPFFMR